MIRPYKKKITFFLFLPILAILSGCEKYYLSLIDQNINLHSLASTHASTPDKRQKSPPVGEMIVMDWRIPKELLGEKPYVELHVLYGNYTEKTFCFPVSHRMGYAKYKNINQEFYDTGGIITYRADLKLASGQVYKSWTHQLWVNLISLEEDSNTNLIREQTAAALKDPFEEDDLVLDTQEKLVEQVDSLADRRELAEWSSFEVLCQPIQESVTEIQGLTSEDGSSLD